MRRANRKLDSSVARKSSRIETLRVNTENTITAVETSKQAYSMRDLYLTIFDASTHAQKLTIEDISRDANVEQSRIEKALDFLVDNALVEREYVDTDVLLTCDDAERMSRTSAIDKYMSIEREYASAHSKQAASAHAHAVVERSASSATPAPKQSTSKQAASKQAAARVATLAEHATSKQTIIARTTEAQLQRFSTNALVEMRNQRVVTSICVCCTQNHAHTTTVQFCSRCYNYARSASAEVLNVASRAVVANLRDASDDQLVAVVEMMRARLDIEVLKLSSKQAAKMLRETLDASSK